MIISELNKLIGKMNRYVCMTRPRRFGKSYVGYLICAYYSRNCDSRSLFDGLKLSQDPSFETYLNKLDVIRIDLGGMYDKFKDDKDDIITVVSREVCKELRKEFPEVTIELGTSLSEAISEIYYQTGRKFVIFIDEYDALVREKVDKELFDSYLRFLNGLFKDVSSQEATALAYITGILPIVRQKMQSKLNVFSEYNFLSPRQFSEFMGFTEAETKQLCERYGMSYEECKYWYDGYKFADGISVLSPKSVCEAMMSHAYADYWCQTDAFTAVSDAIKYSQLDLTEKILELVRGEHIKVDIRSFVNTVTDFHNVDDVLTYCIQLGYLAYDANKRECYIPNAEVRNQWIYVAENIEETHVVAQLLKASEDLLHATIEKDLKAVAEGLREAHKVVSSSRAYNDENQFRSAIIYAYYYAQNAYTIVTEFPTGDGFADVAFLPKYPTLGFPALIVELKKDKSVNTAMQQIEEKKYGLDLLHYRGNMLLVAVAYDSDDREHACQIKDFIVD